MLVHGRSLHPAYSHPKTHGIPVAIIHFRSHFPHLLTLFTHVALHAAAYLGIPTSGVISLPTQRSLWTVLRSPFIHKKSQENFERRVHKRAIKAWDADPEVVERWAQYLRKRRIGGVGMRVVKWVHVEVGIGRTRLQHVEMGDDATVSSEKIRSLGDAIAQEELATPPKAAKKTPASPN
ncbi:ribosomal protein S10 domain-containing protein [Cyathus striatus]|nr:ribosomal protein S10 domain-containing protein [Cyathus striatus]